MLRIDFSLHFVHSKRQAVPSEQRFNRFAVVGVEEFAAEFRTSEIDFAKVHYTDVAVEHRADVDFASSKVGRGGELRR